MKVAKFIGNKEIQIIDRDLRDIDDNEILLQVAFCGVCGSESRVFNEGFQFVPGHEISGKIISVGKDVRNLDVGQNVIIYLIDFCGKCEFCENGETHICSNRGPLIGWHMDGGYAEYVIVPSSMVIPVPFEDKNSALGVLVLDTIGTSFHGLRKCNINPETDTLVFGCGPLGLGAVLILKNYYNVKNLFCADICQYRLDLAQELGAIPILIDPQSTEESLKNKIRNQPDLVVEVVGKNDTLQASMGIVANNGTVLLLGEPTKEFIIKRKPDWLLKDFSIIRSFYFPISEVPENIEFVQSNTKELLKLVTHHYCLDDIELGFKKFFSGQSGKVLIHP